jgi:D-alanyl-D-alanine carboxypeptidase/D-alanyl-D-alanine-endopeptidase (penicillin-binding protein 4)
LLHIFGTLPAGTKPLNLAIAVRDPAQYAAAAFATALTFQGVEVHTIDPPAHRPLQDTASFAVELRQPLVLRPAGSPVAATAFTGRVVATRTSPPLSQIVTVTNKVSQNLHAELLLRLLGSAQGDDGSIAQGVRVVRQFLVSAGIDPLDFSFDDGSGLSPQDLITPRATTALLVYAARQSWGAEYRASLPVGGVDGSLAGRFTQPALKGRVFAKTGTLSQVNALSGYLIAADGRTLAFSVLSNDYVGAGSRATLDSVVAAVAAAF